MTPALKLFLILIGAVALVDLVFLNTVTLSGRREKVGERLATLELEMKTFLGREGASEAVTVATGSDNEEQMETGAAPEPATQMVTTQAANVTKEVFIPLGSAATFATDWVDTGAQVYIDTSIYPNLEAAYFQGSLRSNSGVISARLKQMNEKTVVPGSEISHTGGNASFIGSGEIFLSAGNKLYAVQLRSQTGQEVFVENARVRFVLR